MPRNDIERCMPLMAGMKTTTKPGKFKLLTSAIPRTVAKDELVNDCIEIVSSLPSISSKFKALTFPRRLIHVKARQRIFEITRIRESVGP
jgi:hypothetical protein